MRRALIDFVFQPVTFYCLLLAMRLAACAVVERRWGARTIDWRAALRTDVPSFLFTAFVSYQAAQYLGRYVGVRAPLPAVWLELPLGLRFVLYVVAADFWAYWVHRLAHLPWLWRIHRWHHAPQQMYWFAGQRGSVLQLTLFNLPYIFMSPLFDISPWWTVYALLILYSVTNDWMHLNVRWRLKGLDWLLVTPRTHHIHHSTEPAHYRSNFGVLFSVWDRLFGTYTSPDAVQPEKLRFGIDDRVSAARLGIGL